MRLIKEYQTSLPRKDDPSFKPPCCPKVESKYLKLLTDPTIDFQPSDGIFHQGSNILGQFLIAGIVGGQDWDPSPNVSGLTLILEKNPRDNQFYQHLIGERNGLALIDNTLFALAPCFPGLFSIRRPFRFSHIPEGSPNFLNKFKEYSTMFTESKRIIPTF